jgi:hypothetical protein
MGVVAWQGQSSEGKPRQARRGLESHDKSRQVRTVNARPGGRGGQGQDRQVCLVEVAPAMDREARESRQAALASVCQGVQPLGSTSHGRQRPTRFLKACSALDYACQGRRRSVRPGSERTA